MPDTELREIAQQWACNDCGVMIPQGDDLCNTCYQKEIDGQMWNEVHPESRCPPRD